MNCCVSGKMLMVIYIRGDGRLDVEFNRRIRDPVTKLDATSKARVDNDFIIFALVREREHEEPPVKDRCKLPLRDEEPHAEPPVKDRCKLPRREALLLFALLPPATLLPVDALNNLPGPSVLLLFWTNRDMEFDFNKVPRRPAGSGAGAAGPFLFFKLPVALAPDFGAELRLLLLPLKLLLLLCDMDAQRRGVKPRGC